MRYKFSMAAYAEDLGVAEDLVLKDSPLDQYLKEIGLTDFNSYSSLEAGDIPQETSYNELISSADVPTRPGKQGHTTISSSYWPFATLVSSFVFVVANFLFPSLPHSLRASLKDIKTLLVNSFIMFDVDKNQTCTTVVNGAVCENAEFARFEKGHGTKEACFIGKSLTIASVFIFFACISMAVLLKLQTPQLIVYLAVPLLLLFVIPVTFAVVYGFYTQQGTNKLCRKTVKLTKDFISNFEAICKTLDKSFLLIRECEVISQGYTFYHPGIPALKSGSRKRGSCAILREASMENCLKLFEVISAITKMLIKFLPKDLYLTYSEDGIFNITQDDLKASISAIGLKGNGVPQTDLIRSVICLIKSELIELFQVILLLVEKNLTIDENLQHEFSNCQELLFTLTGIYEGNSSTLCHILDDLGSKYSFVKENEFKENLPQKKTTFGFPSSPIQMKIDSTFLHLKSAMGHLEYLESILPHGLVADDCLRVDDGSQEEIKKLVEVFSHDLECAKDCVTDVNNLFSVKSDRMPVDKSPILSKSEALEQHLGFDCHNGELAAQEGDLLLEGVSDASYTQDEFMETEQQFLEEKILRGQLNENKRLIKELEVIFSFKKSPIGLVPLDLVKENMNSAKNMDESSCDATIEKPVSLNEIRKKSFDSASEYEADNSSHTPGDQSTMWDENESGLTKTGMPPISLMNDLKLMFMNRPQQSILKECMIETDTCTSDMSDNDTVE